jgi:hypothetical protein
MNHWTQALKTTYQNMLREEASLDGPNSGQQTPPDLIKELTRQGWNHAVHNPERSSGSSGRGYFITEKHPKHEGWYKEHGPYYGD